MPQALSSAPKISVHVLQSTCGSPKRGVLALQGCLRTAQTALQMLQGSLGRPETGVQVLHGFCGTGGTCLQMLPRSFRTLERGLHILQRAFTLPLNSRQALHELFGSTKIGEQRRRSLGSQIRALPKVQ